MQLVGSAKFPIHRVVTCFILTQQGEPPTPKIALFHRCETMPTFANFWAGISGTIEDMESPYQAAKRELSEETNLPPDDNIFESRQGGLYVDVPFISPRTKNERLIRVYPFLVHLPSDVGEEASSELPQLELRGTEHDRFQFVTIQELEDMESQCVPGLVQAFHHATYGKYDTSISSKVREWANDKANGASVMARNALLLLHEHCDDDGKKNVRQLARHISMLRPSMVPIVNVMNRIYMNGRDAVTVETFKLEVDRCVALGIEKLKSKLQTINDTKRKEDNAITVATFSRSGTLAKILMSIVAEATGDVDVDVDVNEYGYDRPSCRIVCAQSTPGDEGELMAQDLKCDWVEDEKLHQMIENYEVDLIVVGSDCVLGHNEIMINKIGTKRLCEVAQRHNVPAYCCADRWKVWDDRFPPPIEEDLFEIVPLSLVSELLLPP